MFPITDNYIWERFDNSIHCEAMVMRDFFSLVYQAVCHVVACFDLVIKSLKMNVFSLLFFNRWRN